MQYSDCILRDTGAPKIQKTTLRDGGELDEAGAGDPRLIGAVHELSRQAGKMGHTNIGHRRPAQTQFAGVRPAEQPEPDLCRRFACRPA